MFTSFIVAPLTHKKMSIETRSRKSIYSTFWGERQRREEEVKVREERRENLFHILLGTATINRIFDCYYWFRASKLRDESAEADDDEEERRRFGKLSLSLNLVGQITIFSRL